MSNDRVRKSKFLSLLLRHRPEQIGLSLDRGGWAYVDEIVRLSASSEVSISRSEIEDIVATSDKQRFVLSPDRQMIRAHQGHSIEADLGLKSVSPPEVLFHGTAITNVPQILTQGILSQSRQFVNLSEDLAIARRVGERHGDATVLSVASGAMHRSGIPFFLSANGVWLTACVPANFISSDQDDVA